MIPEQKIRPPSATHEKLDYIIQRQEALCNTMSHLTDTLATFCDRLTEALREREKRS